LRRALSRAPVGVVGTGDYQPAEKKFEVSRRMLEVSLELGFPVSILERSPLVWRDLELVKQINQRAPSVVFFHLIAAPDSPTYERVREMENLVPKMEKRYAAVELENGPGQHIWAYRKAAWAIEDTQQDLGLIYRAMGRKGLESIENIGPAID
jgi:hypothetical protein